MNKSIMRAMGFNKEVDAVTEQKCPLCFKLVNKKDFRTKLDLQEFKISGICQKCQDEVFNEEQ